MQNFDFEFGAAPNVESVRRNVIKSVQRDLEETELIGILNSANVGYDLGSGRGETAVALLELCPNLRELHAVDLGIAVSSPETRKIIGNILKTHDKTRINVFLEQAAKGELKKADVVMMALVPTHRFNEVSYKNLGSCINGGGILIELGDTNLHPDHMRNYFNLRQGKASMRNYWIKK